MAADAAGAQYNIHDAKTNLSRIIDRVDLTGSNGTFDLDAVAIVNADCP